MSTENKPVKKRRIKWLLITRRVHLYTGIFLFPFIILIGLSGFLFNHNSSFWGGPVESVSLPESNLSKISGNFQTQSAAESAGVLIEQLNEGDKRYKLVKPEEASYEKSLVFQSGSLRVEVDPETGKMHASRFNRNTGSATAAPFNAMKATAPLFKDKDIADSLNGLFPGEKFRLASSRSPELNFIVEDGEGKLWKTGYDFSKQQFSGYAADDKNEVGFYGFLTKLHKTHHYPSSLNGKWLWIFFADCCGIAMLLWGISGLILAWQIRPVRKLCMVLLVLSLVIATSIAASNYNQQKQSPPQIRSSTVKKSNSEQRPERASRTKKDLPVTIKE